MDKKILIVEDEPLQRQMLETLITRKLEFKSITAHNGRDALDVLKNKAENSIALIIMDLNMPIMSGQEALPLIVQSYPHIPVIVLTGSTDIKDAVNAMKAGATDFLAKPYEGDRMVTTIKNAMKISFLKQEVTLLKKTQNGTHLFTDMIGHDGGLNKTITMGRKVASSDISTLITGPTGAGKEILARAIHGESHRGAHPFIAVNCGAIPAQLIESTLFGHEKGAFTGATEEARGKFREAEGGTIFLDEIGELPMDAQVKLLRVLQQKEVEVVGKAAAIPINVRVLSATNRNLAEEVQQNRFREDLYFRLNVLEMHLPALRDRKQDIPQLVQHFIMRFCAHNDCIPPTISDSAHDLLIAYHWPGNVRQLENTIHRAIALSDQKTLILSDFEHLLRHENDHTTEHHPDIATNRTITHNPYMTQHGDFKTIETLEHDAMRAALEHFDGNITAAATALGIAKSTFYRKMKAHNSP